MVARLPGMRMKRDQKDMVNNQPALTGFCMLGQGDELQCLHGPSQSCRLSLDREGMQRKDVIDSGHGLKMNPVALLGNWK